jgi:hypothetical protein
MNSPRKKITCRHSKFRQAAPGGFYYVNKTAIAGGFNHQVQHLGGHIEFAAAQGSERTCPGNLLIAELDGLRKWSNLNAPIKK